MARDVLRLLQLHYHASISIEKSLLAILPSSNAARGKDRWKIATNRADGQRAAPAERAAGAWEGKGVRVDLLLSSGKVRKAAR